MVGYPEDGLADNIVNEYLDHDDDAEISLAQTSFDKQQESQERKRFRCASGASTIVTVSPTQCREEFPGELLVADGGRLFCTTCSRVQCGFLACNRVQCGFLACSRVQCGFLACTMTMFM